MALESSSGTTISGVCGFLSSVFLSRDLVAPKSGVSSVASLGFPSEVLAGALGLRVDGFVSLGSTAGSATDFLGDNVSFFGSGSEGLRVESCTFDSGSDLGSSVDVLGSAAFGDRADFLGSSSGFGVSEVFGDKADFLGSSSALGVSEVFSVLGSSALGVARVDLGSSAFGLAGVVLGSSSALGAAEVVFVLASSDLDFREERGDVLGSSSFLVVRDFLGSSDGLASSGFVSKDFLGSSFGFGDSVVLVSSVLDRDFLGSSVVLEGNLESGSDFLGTSVSFLVSTVFLVCGSDLDSGSGDFLAPRGFFASGSASAGLASMSFEGVGVYVIIKRFR